jgi:hypothetical protein
MLAVTIRRSGTVAAPTARPPKGDGVTDDTPAIQDAFDNLKSAYVTANPTGSATEGYDGSNYWVYLPNGTYRVTSTLSYRGPDLVTSTFGSDLVRRVRKVSGIALARERERATSRPGWGSTTSARFSAPDSP